MAQTCDFCGKNRHKAHKVSHSNIKTRRTFAPNLQDRRYFIPEEDKWITLRVSASGMRTIDKIGLSEAMKRAKAKGFL